MKTDEQKGHEHNYQIFRDSKAVGFLTFYCTRCLKLRKIKKEYNDNKNNS